MILALLSAIITGLLAGLVAREYRARRKPHQLAWALSLAMGTIASLAYAGCVALGGSPLLFRIYYLFGALLMAPCMGLGSLYLVQSPSWSRRWTVVIATLSAVGAAALLTAPLDHAALASFEGGAGRGILQLSTTGRLIVILLNLYGTAAVVGVALLSAIRLRHGQASLGLVLGNGVLAAGVLIVGAAGSAAGTGRESLFWPVMTLGWVVFFIGYSVINRTREVGRRSSHR